MHMYIVYLYLQVAHILNLIFPESVAKYNRLIVPNNAHHILSSIRIIYMYIYMHSLMLLYM